MYCFENSWLLSLDCGRIDRAIIEYRIEAARQLARRSRNSIELYIYPRIWIDCN
jgi:hypothetical protein